jgi:hypothetical protein
MLTTFFDVKNILENEKLINLKNHIYEYLEIFTKQIKGKKYFSITESWLQAYRKKDYHSLHVHKPNLNDYSLIFYIQCTKDSSKTIFYAPGHPYVTSPNIKISAEKSKIVFFPGGTPHEVSPNDDEQRIIFSCNFEIKDE